MDDLKKQSTMYSDHKNYISKEFKAYSPRNRTSLWVTTISCCLLFILSTTYFFIPSHNTVSNIAGNKYAKFFQHYFTLLQNSVLNDDDPFPIGVNAVETFENIYRDMSETVFNEYDFFDDEIIEKLKIKHKNIVSKIPENVEIPYYQNNGYVTVGGGDNDYYSLLLVKQLRDLGAKEKIEVIIPPTVSSNEKLCNEIFPSLNATCLHMKDTFGLKNLSKLNFNRHSINVLSVLASSFRNAFFIAPSTIPLHNPDLLFNSKIFNDYKLLLWPTIYRSTISPTFYKVAGIDVENIKIRILNDRWSDINYYKDFVEAQKKVTSNAKQNFHDLKGTSPEYATDSNLYLINKIENFDTLLLSLYYTNDGPSRYFSLLNIAKSESNGDYLMAATHYLKKSYYQNLKTADKIGQPIGHINTITGHYNPIEDYNILQGKLYELSRLKEAGEYEYDYFNDIRRPFNVFSCTPMFFYVEEAGLNPFKIVGERSYNANDNIINKRIFGNHIKFYGIDFELKITQHIHDIICSNDLNISFSLFSGYNMKNICSDFIEHRLHYLNETSDEYWNKYLFDKKGPYPVPDAEISKIQDIIKAGYENDKDFSKVEVKRVKSATL